MTEIPDHLDPDCCCVNVGDALRLAFAGQQAPECPTHDQPTDMGAATPLALNDDAGLKAIIGRALGATTTSSTYREEFPS